MWGDGRNGAIEDVSVGKNEEKGPKENKVEKDGERGREIRGSKASGISKG